MKPCETLRNAAKPYLRKCASVLKPAKSYLQKFAKPKNFCESLQKYLHFAIASSCENTNLLKLNLLNLAKGVSIASSPPPAQAVPTTALASSSSLSAPNAYYTGMPTNL